MHPIPEQRDDNKNRFIILGLPLPFLKPGYTHQVFT